MSKKEDDSKMSSASSQGVNNDHPILKEANTDDSEGMQKYGVDLNNDTEKTSRK